VLDIAKGLLNVATTTKSTVFSKVFLEDNKQGSYSSADQGSKYDNKPDMTYQLQVLSFLLVPYYWQRQGDSD